MFTLGFVILLCLAFVGGRSSVPDMPAAAVGEEPERDDSWPIMSPEPEEQPDLRNVKDASGEPVQLNNDPQVSPVDSEGAADEELFPVEVDLKLWAVMVGQKLTADVEIVDQLLTYVDSGLTNAVSRIRVRELRTGDKRYDVYVGPFETKEEARKAWQQLLDLRSTLGIRFTDSYITRMNFSPEELNTLSPPMKRSEDLGQ